MRRFIFLLFYFPLLLSANATITVSGKLPIEQIKEIGVHLPFHFFRLDKNTHWTQLEADGSFSVTLDLPETQFAFLRIDQQWIKVLLEPGSDLFITDPGPDKQLRFAGSLAAVNELFASLHAGERVKDPLAAFESVEDPQLLWRTIEAKQMADQEQLEDFLREHPEKERFRDVLRQEVRYYHLELFYRVGKQRSYVFPIDSTFDQTGWRTILATQFIPENLQNETALPSLSYFWWLSDYFDWEQRLLFDRFQALGKDAGMAMIEEVLGERPSTLFPRLENDKFFLLFKHLLLPQKLKGRVLEKALVGDLYVAASQEYFENLEEAYQLYRGLFPEGRYLSRLDRKLEPVINKFRDTQADNSQNTYTFLDAEREGWDSLAQVLRPYRGQVVLVDLWFSTCGPCREEFRHLPALKERFQDQDLAYLYISTDSPSRRDHWQTTARYYGLTGKHILGSRTLLDEIWQDLPQPQYAYPRYLLVDRSGRISTKQAPLPSEKEKLYRAIDQLLLEK
ncbi:TlpA family protein disulfide reductase [Flavilitoribacter nigricans]|uniref:Thioredoxin domain-containing protein n=1 Tax=Flavilitoribacter nigricans (strain ATCC 23147 / DSM 23189 / NBRC 102662 / NCIMB 1420 / SS-2) TaxID=1122177 RepID=A0A2D0N6H3_FLAN2|nr:TlpA disulfide reductase family protein [Flavilitoribacter nigricans]PHN04121.1 hypothetical protein CRP01_23275 [Flavilitoribacter nigricans DSM 23189 = NBRC 102662]